MMRVLALGMLVCAAPAAAQLVETGAFNIERFRAPLDRNGILDVESGAVGRHMSWDATFLTSYALNPLVLTTTDSRGGRRVDALVAHRLGGNLVGSLSVLDWIEVGLDVPVIFAQARDAGAFKTSLTALDESATNGFGAFGVGDVRLVAKSRVLRQVDGLADVAVIAPLTLPTAFPQHSYFGDGGVTFAPELALSFGDASLRFAGNVAARLRPEVRFLNLTTGPELTTRGALAWRPDGDRDGTVELALGASAVTSLSAPLDAVSSGFELLAGATVDVAGDAGLQLFATGALSPDAVFGMPTSRALAGIRWAPRVFDTDDDGLVDELDRCLDAPEDRDGIRDDDGCPEHDDDGDGVLDPADLCARGTPNAIEDRDWFQDTDGCAEPDNDNDGILDVADGCRMQAEDKDGDRDGDGCPEDPLDGDEDGIADLEDKCPAVAGLFLHGGCPRPDEDKDGVADADDRCANVPGPARRGGCPDEDGDGIFDMVDACPLDPELINGKDDDDGCVESGPPPKVKLSADGTSLELTEDVVFLPFQSAIAPRSENLLKQLASTLRAHREITKLRIDGRILIPALAAASAAPATTTGTAPLKPAPGPATPGATGAAGFNPLVLGQRSSAGARDKPAEIGAPKATLPSTKPAPTKNDTMKEQAAAALASARANAVRDRLIASGVDGQRLALGEAPLPADAGKKRRVIELTVVAIDGRDVLAAATATAPADKRAIAALILERAEGFKACIEEAAKLGTLPLSSRKRSLTITIQPDGSVGGARFTDAAIDASDVGVCIRRTAKRWRFPPFAGDAVDVEMPLVLTVN